MYINGYNLCIGCMRPLDAGGECSFCGLKQEEYTPIPRCLSPGTELAGRYVTGRVLGEGSFGITYMGWDTYMDIPVAVKEYFPCDMVSRDVICGSNNSVYLYENEKKHDYNLYLKKFWGEAKCLSRFNQVEGIVSVRDFFYENNTAYLVMQYVDGISVKKYVAENGKIPASQVLEQIRPVLLALEQVHNTGIVHRDISPDNLMIKEDGRFVLIDFGAARMRNIDTTKTMTVMFKRGFSPEEQYRCKGKWGPYTDVYSICATIYFMMTGSSPVDSVIRALGDEMPSLVSMKELDIPVRQRKAVMKGLAVAAKNRWQDIGELYEALFEQGEGEGGRRGRLRGMERGKWGRGKRITAIALCMVLFALSIYFVWKNAGGEPNDHIAADQTEPMVSGTPLETGTVEGAGSGLADTEAPTAENSQPPLTANSGERTGRVKIPKLVGLNDREAKERLEQKGLKCKIKQVERSEKKGTVVAQSIRAGKKVTGGTKVTVTVSNGTKPVSTPKATMLPKKTSSPKAEDKKKPAGSEGEQPGKKGDFAGVIQ